MVTIPSPNQMWYQLGYLCVILQNDYWPNMPYVLFGVIALVAGIVTIKLPETKGKTIPDSLSRKCISFSHIWELNLGGLFGGNETGTKSLKANGMSCRSTVNTDTLKGYNSMGTCDSCWNLRWSDEHVILTIFAFSAWASFYPMSDRKSVV